MKKELTVTYLRCEYKVNPLGIDTVNPRLGWIIECANPNQKGEKQTAYQVMVSSTKEKLDNNIADLWNCGKVVSDQSNQVEYAGKTLISKIECWWKVRIWGVNDNVTEWSKEAMWTMGMLYKKDWKAQWVGYDEWERREAEKDKLEFVAGEDKWIWYPMDKTEGEKGIGSYFFRKNFAIKKIEDTSSAEIIITADERFKLYINGKKIEQSDNYIFSWTRPKQIDISSYLQEGKNALAVECINTYLEKPGLAAKLILTNRNGEKEIIRTDDDWEASNRLHKDWVDPDLETSKWLNAKIVALMGDKPWRIPKTGLSLPPPPYIRKNFRIKKKIKAAYVYVSSLGLYKLYINGQSVSDDRFTPGWTDYNKRVYYNTYDVKRYLNFNDSNCIGIILADGWYAGYIGWEKGREYYGKNPRAFLQLEIDYEDGTTGSICTDKTWKASYGPIIEADLLMGETYDSKKEREFLGWNNSHFDDKNWGKIEISKEIN
ncbi:MAG: hypothetical protein EHM47_14220, partial [Ignavibacteriales bacterium]